MAQIQYLDYTGKVLVTRQYSNALLTEVTFPSMDGAVTDGGTLTIALQPESSRDATAGAAAPGGGGGGGSGGGPGGVAKTNGSGEWAGFFRVTLAGIEASTVGNLQTLSVTRKLPAIPVGELRENQQQPAGEWQVSNLVFDVLDPAAPEFRAWHADFVEKGNNGDDKERTLTIDLIDRTGKTLLGVNCTGVGIVSAQMDVPPSTGRSRRAACASSST